MNKKTLLLLAMATAILMVGVGCAKQDTNDQTSAGDNTVTTVADGTADWETFLGSQFQFSFKYPNDWFIIKGSIIKSQPESVFISKVQLKEEGEDLGNLSIVVNKSSIEDNIRENLISREEITFADRSATKIKFTGDWGPPMISILVPYDEYTFVISYDPEDKDYSSIEKILSSFSFETTAQSDLEKSVIDEKDELFRTYDKTSKELSSGYPVIFSNTSDPAVRFTILTHSGGDAMKTTQYFINQAEQKTLQIDTEVLGGDFGDSGKLELSLNGGSVIVIRRAQVVNSEKREIEYQGLRVNENLILTFNNLIFKPTKALEFTVLGVSSDLTLTYFSDDLKQYSYNIVSNDLQEINELPSFMAKPIK